MWNVKIKTSFIRVHIAVVLMFGTVFVPMSKALAAESCQDLFKSPLFTWKPNRLYDHYLNEIFNLGDSRVQAMNKQTIQDLRDLVPPKNAYHAQAITDRDAQNLVNAARSNAVVGYDAREKYQQKDSDTGFCFGRAAYLHLTALKMGLQKESIKKIWAVGPMKSSVDASVTWGYHVATIVYTKKYGWLVLDPNYYSAKSIEDWMKIYNDQSIDKRIRYYVTEAEKLGLYTGKYNSYDMGLNLNRDEDFFKGYFSDLMASVRTETLASLNLRHVGAEEGAVETRPEPATSGLKSFVKDFFGF